MNYLEALILGIIQGLTEFLPVSSSGHLVIGQGVLGIEEPGNLFEVLVHVGTLCSVLIYFRKRLFELLRSVFTSSMTTERRLILLLFLATLPVVFAVLFKDPIESAFESPLFASAMLCVTGVILFLPSWLMSSKRTTPPETDPTIRQALIMGVGQMFAILPGISRSGTTITAGLMAGVNPSKAAEFSFLMAIPAILGGAVFKLKDVLMPEEGTAAEALEGVPWGPYLSGTVAAFIFGLLAVYLVLATVRRGKFQYFGFYCLALGLVGIFFFSR